MASKPPFYIKSLIPVIDLPSGHSVQTVTDSKNIEKCPKHCKHNNAHKCWKKFFIVERQGRVENNWWKKNVEEQVGCKFWKLFKSFFISMMEKNFVNEKSTNHTFNQRWSWCFFLTCNWSIKLGSFIQLLIGHWSLIGWYILTKESKNGHDIPLFELCALIGWHLNIATNQS